MKIFLYLTLLLNPFPHSSPILKNTQVALNVKIYIYLNYNNYFKKKYLKLPSFQGEGRTPEVPEVTRKCSLTLMHISGLYPHSPTLNENSLSFKMRKKNPSFWYKFNGSNLPFFSLIFLWIPLASLLLRFSRHAKGNIKIIKNFNSKKINKKFLCKQRMYASEMKKHRAGTIKQWFQSPPIWHMQYGSTVGINLCLLFSSLIM